MRGADLVPQQSQRAEAGACFVFGDTERGNRHQPLRFEIRQRGQPFQQFD
jgi:hypothetical protein